MLTSPSGGDASRQSPPPQSLPALVSQAETAPGLADGRLPKTPDYPVTDRLSCGDLFAILSTIQKGPAAPSPEIVDELAQRGFIEFRSANSKAIEWAALETKVHELAATFETDAEKQNKLAQKVDRLQAKLDSKWFYVTSLAWVGGVKMESERCKLDLLKSDLEIIDRRVLAAVRERSALEERQSLLNGLPETSAGFITLTGHGEQRIKELALRGEQYSSKPFGDFERDFKARTDALATRLGRYEELKSLLETIFHDGGSANANCAAIGAASQLFPADAAGKISAAERIIAPSLKGLRDSSRLIASEIVSRCGDLDASLLELNDRLTKTAPPGCSSWPVAIALHGAPGGSSEGKVRRFEAALEVLNGKGWNSHSPAVRDLAAMVACREGDVGRMAIDLTAIEELVSKTGNRSIETAAAAAVLLDGPGSPQDRAARFHEAVDTMNKRGWMKIAALYPAAAIVSVMDGSVAEIVDDLDAIFLRLKGSYDFMFTDDVTMRALSIMTEGNRVGFSGEAASPAARTVRETVLNTAASWRNEMRPR